MGIYVYALETKVHTFSDVTVGVAEFRYKEHTMFDADEENQKMYNRRCKRRVEHFKENKLPFFFVMKSIEGPAFVEGMPVFSQMTKDNRLVGACFCDSIKFNKVGSLTKIGRSWSIKWD